MADVSRRPLILFGIGAALGLSIAAGGLLQGPEASSLGLPRDAIARVNDIVIQGEDFRRYYQGVAKESRQGPGPELRERVLERMIEEELLVQRALELGLARLDRRTRADLLQALITSIRVEAEDREPTRRELRKLYREDLEFFVRSGRMRVGQVFFSTASEDAEARAQQVWQAARDGADFATLSAEQGDAQISPIPQALLPPQKLLQYVGPTVLRSASELKVGQISTPIKSGTGYHILKLLEREDALVPPLEKIEDLVRSEWTRRRGETALREYLEALKREADIEKAPS